MRLNTLKPADGAKKDRKRVGRGIGSGLGKTCGRGHKGQHSRSGGFHKVGFEGGQMPLQRRVPKFGFKSMTARYSAEIRLSELSGVDGGEITLQALKDCNVIRNEIKKAKIIASGSVTQAYVIKGLGVSAGARLAIEAAGGKIEE